MSDLIIGQTAEVQPKASCKVMVSVMEINHSPIIVPGRPARPQMDPRIKFIAQVLVPTPQGPVAAAVPATTREEAIEGIKQALPQMMRDFDYLSLEQFMVEV
jgi:hypothetical protein